MVVGLKSKMGVFLNEKEKLKVFKLQFPDLDQLLGKASLVEPKYPLGWPNEPDIPPKCIKKVRLDIYRT